MIRRCDGNDPNLIMYVHPATGERLDEPAARVPQDRRPCDCGRTFDDVHRMTIWPHHLV